MPDAVSLPLEIVEAEAIMPLIDLELPLDDVPIPSDVRQVLRDADRRLQHYLAHARHKPTGFVPSDSGAVYQALRHLVDENLAPGPMFCEWGSGLGIATVLASMLEFEAYGIEIEGNLIEAAREFADACESSAEFVQGSFVPPGAEEILEEGYSNESTWLSSDSDRTYEDLGVDPSDFDVVYVYPWPSEEDLMADLFEFCAADGALLLTYTQLDGVRVRRKVSDGGDDQW